MSVFRVVISPLARRLNCQRNGKSIKIAEFQEAEKARYHLDILIRRQDRREKKEQYHSACVETS